MANILYTKIMEQVQRGLVDMDSGSAVFRCMLEEEASTYTPNRDHDFVSDLTGFAEVTASGYARQNLANKVVGIDDTNDRTEFDVDDLSFGNIATGDVIISLIIYVQVGGNDLSPSDDPLVARFDTFSGSTVLPMPTNGGTVSFPINAEGLIQTLQG